MAFNKGFTWLRKNGAPRHLSSVLFLTQEEPWEADVSWRFWDLNESASIDRTDHDSRLLRFSYVNDFYGSCTFVAQVIERKNLPLRLDDDSVSLETYQVKKGNLPLLLHIAKIFLRRMLGKYCALRQMRG